MNPLCRRAFLDGVLVLLCLNSNNLMAQASQSPNNSVVASQSYKSRLAEIQTEMKALCKSAELAPYFNKTPCSTNDMTAEQLNDQSKVSPTEKVALNKAAQTFGLLFAESNNLLRTYDSKSQQIVKYRETVSIPAQNDARNELAEGKITWGEYNKRRKMINDTLQTEQKRIQSSVVAGTGAR